MIYQRQAGLIFLLKLANLTNQHLPVFGFPNLGGKSIDKVTVMDGDQYRARELKQGCLKLLSGRDIQVVERFIQ